jgi:hypothetical protein
MVRILKAAFLLGMILAVIGGCSKPYVITTNLEAPVNRGLIVNVGEITDQLPVDFDVSKKPTTENIDKFKSYLEKALANQKIFGKISTGDESPDFEVTGSILDYKKGSGFLRFMFGMGIGAAKVTVSLRLKDMQQNKVIFDGNFIGAITGGFESGDKMFDNVAKNFAKAFKKQLESLEKQKK